MGSLIAQVLTMVVFGLHIAGGVVGLGSGLLAAFAPKGGRIHRLAGNVFLVSMLVMAVFACWLALAVPGQISNLFGGAFVFYLVATAWMTARRRERGVGLPEKVALAAVLCLAVPFAFLCVLVASGRAPSIQGPVVIAVFVLAFVVCTAAASDVRVIVAGGISGAPRVARHLWRMCLALTFATGSFFTNAVPRLIPGPMTMSPLLFLPMLLPLGLLIFWMIKVRFAPWIGRRAIARVALQEPV